MLDGVKNVDVRLADFELDESDIIWFEEWNQELECYTGRRLKKTVKHLFKIDLSEFNTVKEMLNHGHYVMELNKEG